MVAGLGGGILLAAANDFAVGGDVVETVLACVEERLETVGLAVGFHGLDAVFEADFIKVSMAMVVCSFTAGSLDDSLNYDPRADGMKELSKQFAVNPALVSQTIIASLDKVSSSIVRGRDKNKIPKAEE